MLRVQKPQKQRGLAEQRHQRHHQCPGSLKNANAFLDLCREHFVVIIFLLNLLFLAGVGPHRTENSSREVVFFIGFAGN